MGRTFAELDEFFSPGLTLTVRGREYVVPLPSAELGLWCRRIAAVAGDVTAASTEAEMAAAAARANERAKELPTPPGDEDLSFEQLLLGTAYDAMAADDVADPYVQFCAQTTYVWIIAGEDAAAQFWHAGGRPEAREPDNRAGRRAAAKTTGRKTSTAAGSATRRPASTSGTSSRRK
ncbi:hypothetical protein GCM10018962_77080 [Dactylosporangium matsuzakiense]|uniref:DUF7426 family protein n=1 Tax=Dactylosporangium matsuzakiense TaxID=53360 RepID=UPI0031F165EE